MTRRHGTTYYWATRVLPAERRPHVHALYGFCRHADEIVDAQDGETVERRRARLDDLRASLGDALATGVADPAAAPAVRAVAHTAGTFAIAPSCFDRFLRSMAMDLTTTGYRTWGDLCDYMDGSAAVIGEMMLPLLGGRDPRGVGPARDLGLAFQLTNFLRDVGEDLDRGRVYLPADDLERFGVDVTARVVTPAWRALVQFETARARTLYASADRGVALLPPWSARSIRAARVLYARILDEIAANDYDVFSMRARVPTATKLTVAAGALLRR
ncbi:MAG TPA: phytoene/squalene synthase family protein [Acidimicrobiales bacterium]|nr:phytoene/squalene synthase family protein [Acidimicrobiales bacterium]